MRTDLWQKIELLEVLLDQVIVLHQRTKLLFSLDMDKEASRCLNKQIKRHKNARLKILRSSSSCMPSEIFAMCKTAIRRKIK